MYIVYPDILMSSFWRSEFYIRLDFCDRLSQLGQISKKAEEIIVIEKRWSLSDYTFDIKKLLKKSFGSDINQEGPFIN